MGSVELMTPSMLERMRASCSLAADTLLHVGEHLRVGMTTEEVNTLVHGFIVGHDAYPSPLNYKPGGAPRAFPKSVCTSRNEVVCHGIPGKEILRDGDIVNVDVTSYFKGFHGDTSATFYVGEPSAQARLVVETARQCLELGIAAVKDGARIGDIGEAIQAHADSQGCSVVRDYVGHGVGREFHMAPQIPHYRQRHINNRLRAGMVFTIEPMINIGHWETEMLDDDWTVVTRDRSLSAQFEHTLLVTRTGAEVLTSRRGVLRGSEDKPWTHAGPLGTRAAWDERQGPQGAGV